MDQNTNSFEINSSLGLGGIPSDIIHKFDSTIEETEISKIRKNIMSLRLSKLNNANKSCLNLNLHSKSNKKHIFIVSNLNSNSNTNQNNTQNIFSNTHNPPGNNKSVNLSFTTPTLKEKKKGRKKFLLDGLKTEIIDKAFLREFKLYLKKSKSLLFNIFDELKQDEKVFWNEFLQNNYPPFYFTQCRTKVEYKSFSKNLLRHIFSHPSVRQLYSIFVKEKGKEIVNSIINKKIKKIDRKTLLFYSFYGKNMDKLYSNEYNMNDINVDELECYMNTMNTNSTACSSNGNVSDSLTSTSLNNI